MRRHLATAIVALLGVGAGLAVGGCLWGGCGDPDPPPLVSTTLTAMATQGDRAFDGDPLDSALTVDVDVEAATVTISYVSVGRRVDRVYRVVSTEDGYYY